MIRKLMDGGSPTAALAVVLVLLGITPATAMSQERDSTALARERDILERVDYINRQLMTYPAPANLGRYQIDLLPGGKLTIDSRMSDSVLQHHEAYIEDIGSIHTNIESREPPYTTMLFVCKTGDCFVVTDGGAIVGAKDRSGFDFAFDRRLARQIESAAEELLALAMVDATYGPPHSGRN